MLKLALVITGLRVGGAETMLLKVVEGIDRNRFEPHIISLTDEGELGTKFHALDVSVTTLGMRSSVPDVGAFARLVSTLRTIRPDLVHTWMYHADLLGGLAARLAGLRSIGWCIRNSDLSPQSSKRTTRAVARACAAISGFVPTRILSCSEMAKRVHVDLGYREDRFVVIPNGFDLTRFKPDHAARSALRRELGLGEDTPIVGMIARFDPQKNHLGFLRAVAAVHQQLPRAHFVFVGKGCDASNEVFIREIGQANLSSFVHLLGQRGDMPHVSAALDVLALPSSYGEAFPNVLGEAMACEVPCVVTDVGDSAYIVGDTGFTVSVGDMIGMSRHIADVLRSSPDARRERGRRARARVLENFSLPKVVSQYEEFYHSFL